MTTQFEYTIPCSWQMYGYLKVQADSLEDAIEIADSDSTKLPNGSYVEASFEVDHDVLEDHPFNDVVNVENGKF